jgi:hypothetical protein
MQSIHNVQVESGTRISLFVEDSVINKLKTTSKEQNDKYEST